MTDTELHWYLGFGIIWRQNGWFEVVKKEIIAPVGSWGGLKGAEQQDNSLELCIEAADFC